MAALVLLVKKSSVNFINKKYNKKCVNKTVASQFPKNLPVH